MNCFPKIKWTSRSTHKTKITFFLNDSSTQNVLIQKMRAKTIHKCVILLFPPSLLVCSGFRYFWFFCWTCESRKAISNGVMWTIKPALTFQMSLLTFHISRFRLHVSRLARYFTTIRHHITIESYKLQTFTITSLQQQQSVLRINWCVKIVRINTEIFTKQKLFIGRVLTIERGKCFSPFVWT